MTIPRKKRVRRVCFPSGRVIEDSAGMARLRSEAFHRSQGKCECWRVPRHKRHGHKPCGGLYVSWWDGHLHHIESRNRGGSDEIGNVAFIRKSCHREITGRLQFGRIVA